MDPIKINWPNKKSSNCPAGVEWLKAAHDANIEIPTGCLVGSCGACEIEVNGEVIRACIATVPDIKDLQVEFFSDPYW
jgi:ferredoxin